MDPQALSILTDLAKTGPTMAILIFIAYVLYTWDKGNRKAAADREAAAATREADLQKRMYDLTDKMTVLVANNTDAMTKLSEKINGLSK